MSDARSATTDDLRAPACDPATAEPAKERVADLIVHAAGGVALAALVLWLLRKPVGQSATVAEALSFTVYLAALGGVIVTSAVYNWIRPGRCKTVLRRVDHAMIYALIAGTYTPFVVRHIASAGTPDGGAATLSLAALVLVWTVAAGGMVLKLACPHRFERLGLALYLGLGWSMAVLSPPVWTALPTGALLLLVAGGLLYTVGTTFHLMERLAYNRAIWHGFVVTAAGCHVAAVALANMA